ncbi:MAG: hypothetical protein PHQ52_05890 [Candidatus Omnitrophica bacterium]|nr:hypothetical protein [Candidatus Omnitrophota bacterium]
MVKNTGANEITQLDQIIQERLTLEKALNFSQRLFKFLYDLNYEAYWLDKNMIGKWRYKTIKQEDVSFEKDKKHQKTLFSFEYNTNFYTALLRIPENQSAPRALVDVMREEKLIFSCIMEKEQPKNIWTMRTLDAFIITDNWFEEVLDTADLFLKEWESLQENVSKSKTPITDTVDTLKQARDFETRRKRFIE